MKTTRTSSRKEQHVAITLRKDVSFRTKSPGFERWEFLHNALPEINLSQVSASTAFLGKTVGLPLILSSMTGGYAEAAKINAGLAEACAVRNIAMGVGSQRQALEDASFHKSYRIAREVAPEIALFGNIGAAEVARLRDVSPIRKLADLIRADGFAVHLNPLQEFLQPEGSPEFSGVLRGIEMMVRHMPIPIIVKEIGAGISGAVARRLLDAGVAVIDVAGAGGTSWAGVEIIRRGDGVRGPATGRNGARHDVRPSPDDVDVFWDWGIPTVDALLQVASLKLSHPDLVLVASGGISSGMDVAKSIALGADLAGVARPALKALERGGVKGLIAWVDRIALQIRGAMFLTGSRSIDELRRQQLIGRP